LPVFIFCGGSVYKKTATGAIPSIAHQGQPAPGGGTYTTAFGAVLNNAGDVVFIGDFSPDPHIGTGPTAIFLNSGGTTSAMARPGDPLPGGGHFVTSTGFYHEGYSLSRASGFVAGRS